MKFNKVLLSLAMLSTGAIGAYAYQFSSNQNDIKKTESINPNPIVENVLQVSSLTDQNVLFNALYHPVDKTNLKNPQDMGAYNTVFKNQYKVSYIEDVLTAYEYKGFTQYVNNGEKRYLVAFSHRSAEYSNDLTAESSSLDLFLFKKSGEKFQLIAQTSQEGLVNGTSGNSAVDDLVFNHIMNSQPVDLGPSYKGYFVNFIGQGGGRVFNRASIILINEQNHKISDIATDDLYLMEQSWGGDSPEYKYDSFYKLEPKEQQNGVYGLDVYFTGTALVGMNEQGLGGKVVPYRMSKTYQFNGESFVLKSKESKNPFSAESNYDQYTKYFSTIDNAGYVPIPYESVLAAIDGRSIDYWLGQGIRFYKPSNKAKEFYTWNVKGLKVHGLDVIGIQRGVCDATGEDRCGWAGETTIILDTDVATVRKQLKEKTFVDYQNLNDEQKKTYPQLYPIKVNGKEKAALIFSNEGEDEYDDI